MSRKRKNTAPHPAPPRPSNHNHIPGSNTPTTTPVSAPAPAPAPTATLTTAANHPDPLLHKFSQLEHILADILNDPATDEQWEFALGSERKKIDFVRTLRELRRGGELRWVKANVGVGRALARENAVVAVNTGELLPATNTSMTAPTNTSMTAPTNTFTAAPTGFPIAMPPPVSSSSSNGSSSGSGSSDSSSGDSNTPWPPPLPPISSSHLLTQVFTHPSHLSAQSSLLSSTSSITHYNRLEFLGDSALHYILTLYLYQRFPSSREGNLTSLRSTLECNATLADYSILYSLPRRTRVGPEAQAKKSGASIFSNQKFCADVFEAYIGALVLDDPTPSGWSKLYTWLTRLMEPKLQSSLGSVPETTPLDRGAREKLNLLVGGVKGVKVEYSWDGGGGGNNGGYWYVAGLTGYGMERVELGRGWGANKGEAMIRAAMKALENTDVLEEVRGRKDGWLRKRGVEKKGIDREKEEIEKAEENNEEI